MLFRSTADAGADGGGALAVSRVAGGTAIGVAADEIDINRARIQSTAMPRYSSLLRCQASYSIM